MIAWKRKLILTACGMATCLLIAPSTSEACGLFSWLRCRKTQQACYRGSCPTTACYGGTSACYGGSCGTCCTQTCQPACQQVVQYMPQTCYRNSWTQVAVTSYRPVQNVDPCTGCAVTCMRPCVSYRWQLQRVPYTTYRPVCGTACSSCSSCGTCGTCSSGTCGTTYYSGGTVVSGQCSSCGVNTTTLPATTVQGATTIQGTTVPSGQVQGSQGGSVPADTAPSLSPTSSRSGTTQYRLQTQETTSEAESGTQEDATTWDITPIPDIEAPLDGENRAPRLLNEDDRRASRPVRQAVAAHPITWTRSDTIQTTGAVVSEPISEPASVEQEEVWDDSGWEAAR